MVQHITALLRERATAINERANLAENQGLQNPPLGFGVRGTGAAFGIIERVQIEITV